MDDEEEGIKEEGGEGGVEEEETRYSNLLSPFLAGSAWEL